MKWVLLRGIVAGLLFIAIEHVVFIPQQLITALVKGAVVMPVTLGLAGWSTPWKSKRPR